MTEEIEGVTVIVVPNWFLWIVMGYCIADVVTGIWKRVLRGKHLKQIMRLKEITEEYDRREKDKA